MTEREPREVAVVKAHGFTVEGCEDDGLGPNVQTPEATFCVFADTGRTEVILWSGAWPFPVEHHQGAMPSIEEAARYADWLLKRQAFYEERDEARIADDMTCSWDFQSDFTSVDYPGYDPQTDHFERFGRPALPNEY